MGALLIVLAVLAVLVATTAGVVVARRRSELRRGRGVPGEVAPRPSGPPRSVPGAAAPPLSRPAPSAEAATPPATAAPPATAPPPATGAPPVEVPEELQAEIEEALQPAVEEATVVEEAPARVRPRFRDRLTKARTLFSGYFGTVLSRNAIDEDTWDELEEAMIRADVGVTTTTSLLDGLRARVRDEGIRDPETLLEVLKADLKKRLYEGDRELRFTPGVSNVWLFVGVNGVGKTTTIGKIGKRQAEDGRSVIMAAGDTFRAAAAEQLGLWAERSGAELIRGAEGADPSAVIFDAVERASARKVDLVLADTAGRLQTKTNLMEELRKIRRVADKAPGEVSEVLLVLDATTGQNGLVQAKQFAEAAGLTGVVLTKLDGTAKGGIALAIQTEFGIPIKLVGLGEGIDDLVPFDPDEFVDALFS